MDARKRSEAVYEAVTFIREVHRDVGTLIDSITADLADRGWERTETNRISSDLTNALSPEWWVINYVSRIFVPRGAHTVDRALLVAVCFRPEAHDHALAFAVAGRFAAVVRRESLWKDWKDAQPLLRALATNPGPGPVNPDATKGVFPTASHVWAVGVPLLELESMDVVNERVLRPMLDALK